MFIFSNVFSSGTTGPIEVKFHLEPSWDGGTKVCIWGPGHVTKMATMPIYGKNPSKIFFSGTAGPICMKFGIHRPGHVTKMATMPIYGKNPSKIFFSGTVGPICMKFGI